jgi:hypothetical protein
LVGAVVPTPGCYDLSVAGRHFAERTFCRKTFCRTNILPNGRFADGRFAERKFCWTDSLTNGQLAENRDIFWTLKIRLHARSKFLCLKSLSILMTETLIVKYSFVLYSFTFLTSLPKIRDIKNNIIQHHPWMWFSRELWMYSMILEVKFAYVVFIYAYLFTIWRQNTFLTNESSAAQTSYHAIVNMVMHC